MLRKYLSLATVLILGATFHALCWSSLYTHHGVIVRKDAPTSCPCKVEPVDQRYSQAFKPAAPAQESCGVDVWEALVLNR